jgi:CRP/FNR family transcriptional regulator, dissimilatory nitrate respiration regulator
MPRPDRTELVDHLKHVPYFAGLDDAALHELAALAIWQEYAPGAVIFLEGDASSGLYSIHTGWVKVIKLSPDGREQVLRYFGPGEVFNEIGMFLQRPNPATAMALEQSMLWQLHRSALQPLLVAHPDLQLQVMGNMADRIAYLAGMVAELSLHSVEARLARLLLDSATGGALVRPSWLTQAELAARLGTVPDVLSRALRTLADAGVIRFDRRQITILDREKLATRASMTL